MKNKTSIQSKNLEALRAELPMVKQELAAYQALYRLDKSEVVYNHILQAQERIKEIEQEISAQKKEIV